MNLWINSEKKFVFSLFLVILLAISAVVTLPANPTARPGFQYKYVFDLGKGDSYVYLLKAPDHDFSYQVISGDGRISQVYKYEGSVKDQPLSGETNVQQVVIFSKKKTSLDDFSFGFISTFTVARSNNDNKNVLGASFEEGAAIKDQIIEKSGLNYMKFSDWSHTSGASEKLQFNEVGNIVIVPIPDGADDVVQYLNAMRKLMNEECRNSSDCSTVPLDYNFVIDNSGTVYEGFTNAFYKTGELFGGKAAISIGVVDNESVSTANSLVRLTNMLLNINGLSEDDVRFNNILGSQIFENLERQFRKGIVPIGNTAGVNEFPIDRDPEGILQRDKYDVLSVAKNGDKIQLIVGKGVSEEAKELLKETDSKIVARDQKRELDVVEIDSESALQIVNTINVTSEAGSTVQPNYMYRLSAWDNVDPDRSIPSDYDPTTHWYLEKTKTPEVWSDLGGCAVDDSCGGDPSVIVAVLDTGVAYEDFDYDAGGSFSDKQHDPFYFEVPGNSTPNSIFNEGYDREYRQAPELAGVNFVTPFDSWQYFTCNSLRLTGTPDPCNAAEDAKIDHANDDHGHGTFVTNVIVGNTGDAAPNMLSSVAHNVSIMPVKVFTPNDTSMCQDENGDIDRSCADYNYDYRAVAYTTNILDGIEHAVDNNADIINMSLGGVGTDLLLNAAIQDATDNGVLVVVAAGNDGDDATYYFPANSPGAYVVGALDDTDARASYSNYGAEIDLVAPVGDSGGSMVRSIKYQCSTDASCSDESDGNLFQTFTSQTNPYVGIGTSYAAPQVAAAAALLLSNDPTMTVSELKSALSNSAYDLGPEGKDTDFGYGMLDIEAALNGEQNVPDPIPNDQYFTWYDTSEADRKTWVLVGNPSTSSVATVGIDVGDVLSREYTVQPENRITPRWNGYLDGPVHVTSDLPIYTTQRVIFEGSFNEYAGIPASSLTNKYYFTWYDTSASDRKAWILVGNPSSTQTANINIKIGDSVIQNLTIPPKGRVTPKWNDILDGPVVVSSDIDVYTSQRVLFQGTFNEFAGIPSNTLTDQYYFTWYDTSASDRKAWILVGNPSTTQTATVNIKIGSQVNQNFSVPPGGSVTPRWSDKLDGPVMVSSSSDVYATQRVSFEGSFNEYAGIPVSNLDTEYFFTWYDTSESDRKAWVLVGNPSTTQAASVNIKVGTTINENFSIPAGGRITPRWDGYLDGPIVVTSDIPVYATQRVLFEGDFNEYPGIITNE